VLAEADKVQTGLDRIATAADKVATNADVVLTNADVVLAEADKVQTGLDRIATAADVVSTNADVVLTNADVAATADKLPKSGGAMTGPITTTSTFDGRTIATDGTKLDTLVIGTSVVGATGATSAASMPTGTTAQRPTGAEGMFRHNVTENQFEGYNNGAWGELGSGRVLQVVSSTLKSAVAITSNSTDTFVSLGLSAAITPVSASSKILVEVTMSAGNDSGTFHFRIARGADQTICIGDAGLSNQLRSTASFREAATPYSHAMGSIPMRFLDSPATTSEVTYSVVGTLGATYNGVMYINRPQAQSNADYDPRGTSTITLTEIKG
jgi:hypothetical protein